MTNSEGSKDDVYEAEVVDSSVIDEGVFRKVVLTAGRTIALPALQAFEMIMAPTTPPQARVSIIAALSYLIMPIDLVPDMIPLAGFGDDLVAITAVLSVWSNYMTPEIRNKARRKLDKWFPI